MEEKKNVIADLLQSLRDALRPTPPDIEPAQESPSESEPAQESPSESEPAQESPSESESVRESPSESEPTDHSAEIEEYATEHVLDEETVAEIKRLLDIISSDFAESTVSVPTLDTLYRAADYDRAVARADAEGELRGRNENITKMLNERQQSDGLPHPNNRIAPNTPRTHSSIFDLAREA